MSTLTFCTEYANKRNYQCEMVNFLRFFLTYHYVETCHMNGHAEQNKVHIGKEGVVSVSNVNVDNRQVLVQMSTHVNIRQVGGKKRAKFDQRSFWTTPNIVEV